MKYRSLKIFFLVLSSIGAAIACRAAALNSASYRLPGMPGYGVAKGSVFVLFGSFLGPDHLVQAASLPLPTTLGDTSVRVTVGGTSVDAYLVYTSANQVAAVLPSNTPTGDGTVTLTYIGRVSNTTPIHVLATSFGIYSHNQAGSGPGAIQNSDAAGQVSSNALNNSARPGQTAVIWGTGLGPISGNDAGVPPTGNLEVDVSVLVGGKSATVLYKGRSGFPGVDQINFQVPDGITGCFVPVAVKAAGTVSNYTSMSITGNGGTCSDVTSFAAQDIDAAKRNGESRLGIVSISDVLFSAPSGATGYQADTGEAEFRRRTLDAFLGSRGLTFLGMPLGTCTAVTFPIDSNNPDALDPGNPVPTTFLSAGGAIRFSGPIGNMDIQRQSSGMYSGLIGGGTSSNPQLPVFVQPGRYAAVGGRDGTDVGSFQVPLQVPAAITWTNMDSSGAVSLASGLKVTWSGGDPAAEYVVVRGSSTDDSNKIRGVFTCAQAADAGSMTVSPDVLSTLPASSAASSNLLEVGTITRSDMARASNSPGGLDGLYFQIQRTNRIQATYQ